MNEEETTGEAYMDAHPPMNCMNTLFNWADNINAHLAGTNTATAATTSNTPSHLPHDFSLLCLGTQNLWGTLSCHHHCHHCSQPPNLPHKPPGTVTITATIIFTHHVHHHLISIHPHTLSQSTPSKWFTTYRGLPPQSLSSAPCPHSPQCATCPCLTHFGHPPSSNGNSPQWTCHLISPTLLASAP